MKHFKEYLARQRDTVSSWLERFAELWENERRQQEEDALARLKRWEERQELKEKETIRTEPVRRWTQNRKPTDTII